MVVVVVLVSIPFFSLSLSRARGSSCRKLRLQFWGVIVD